jgi:hypothetical protein
MVAESEVEEEEPEVSTYLQIKQYLVYQLLLQ